jgi:hypothetical protein
MARKPADSPALVRFAEVLAGHMTRGTRPTTASGGLWTDAALAREVMSSRDNEFVSPRTISNWRKGQSLPEEIEPLARALFGPGDRHFAAREELRAAFVAARAEKLALITARAKRDPAGGTWVIEDDERLVLDRSVRATDRFAAADPLRQQLQTRIRDMAADLVEPAKRLTNARSWARLSATAEAFRAVVDCPPAAVTDRLGDAYALMLRLGGFLETDIRVQRDPAAMDDPLDPDIHGLLTDLIRTAAPWLRGFPTVAAWDDAAGKALVRADLFQPAREFTRIARERRTISERDAAEMEVLADAANADGFQGQKAGNRAVGHARNLLLTAASMVATFLAGSVASDFATRSLVVQRAGATLFQAEKQVEAFAASLSGDLRQALRALIKGAQNLDWTLPTGSPTALPDKVIPEDVEEQAQKMILAGNAPPAAWRPFIRRLNFRGQILDSLNPLAGLTALESLSLVSMQVSDLIPLTRLSALRNLNLTGTQVRSLAPLTGLTTLESLDLTDTRVSDVAHLAGLAALQNLSLWGTQVSDVAPLAGLTALRSLDLTDTQVGDVAHLAGLTALQILSLVDTSVTDVSSLAGLTALRKLILTGTQVSDLSALDHLTDLEIFGGMAARKRPPGRRGWSRRDKE